MTPSNKIKMIGKTALTCFVICFSALLNAQTKSASQSVIADTAEGAGPAGASFFMVIEQNNVAISETAFTASQAASLGRGKYNMVLRQVERPVASGRTTLKLHGIHSHVTPIDTIFRAVFLNGNPEVSGEISVDLLPGERYRVTGQVDPFVHEVWLEDSHGKQVIGSKLVAPPAPELVKLMEGASYITTNLHYDDDWISEVPWLQSPLIPVGARLKVVDWSSNRARILINGRKMRIGVDFTRDKESIKQLVARITSVEDPRVKIASYPEMVRNAIHAGRVFPGMTREQVLIALGRPRIDFTPKLEVSEWKYEVPEQGDLYLMFDDSGILKTIDGSRVARNLVLYEKP